MFVIRLIVYLLIVIAANGFEDIKELRQRRNSNENQWLESDKRLQFLSRKKRQSVIRNSQPGQRPQIQGIDTSPVFIYLENEKDLETLLTNSTLDDIINAAEGNISPNAKPQYPTNGRTPQYQQQIQQIPASYMNYNTQTKYNNRNPSATATAETVYLSYDQLNSYFPQGSVIHNDKNQNDKIFVQLDDNVNFSPGDILLPVTTSKPMIITKPSIERDNSFRYPTRQELLSRNNNQEYNLPSNEENKDRLVTPSEIPLSLTSIISKEDQTNNRSFDKSNNQNSQTIVKKTDTKTEPSEIISRDEVIQDRNTARDGNEQNDDKESRDPDRWPPNNDRRPPDYDSRSSDYDRRPPDYDRRPNYYDRGPPDYDRRPDYYRRPSYDQWNRGWNRRPPYGRDEPSYGWRPHSHGRGPPPHSRGRGPPGHNKQPPYVINLNFDSGTAYPNGTLRHDNETLTDNSNAQEQNPDIYETLKSIFQPKSGVALSNNDDEKSDETAHEASTVRGLYQVSPVTPAE